MLFPIKTLALAASLIVPASLALSQDAQPGLPLPPAFGDGTIAADKYYDGGSSQGDLGAQNLAAFDTLDFDVFSSQAWDRLHESHNEDIVVTWPDGHSTVGIDPHIEDLKKLFVHAPDTAIKVHPIRMGSDNWTAVMGVMSGTFTEPMKLPDGSEIAPTGKAFSLPMMTMAYWKDGRIVHEWLSWDNASYMAQLGL